MFHKNNLLCFFVLVTCSLSTRVIAQMDSCARTKNYVDSLLQTVNEQNYETTIALIEEAFNKPETCFKSYQIQDIYSGLAEHTLSYTKNGEITYYLKKKAILNGYVFYMILEDTPAIFLKDNFYEKYKDLEHLTDSMFLVKNKSINIELSFRLRSMIRRDQEVRIRKRIADLENNKTLSDSLYNLMSEVDLLNELLLTEIFEQYGYPGYSLVGSEHNACSLLMHHMSLDFQLKYIYLLDQAVANKELFENLNFLIDKILYNKYGVTLYGTHWSGQKPVTEPELVEKYRSLLNLMPQ